MKLNKFLVTVLFIIPIFGFSQTEEEYISKGLDKEEVGAFEEAILFYDSAILLNNENAIAYYNRGVCYAALQNYGSALVDYNKALYIDTTLADAYYNRSIVFHHMDNPVMALADIQVYTQMQPADTLGFLVMADLLFKQGEFSQAIATNQKLINLGLERKAIVYRNQGVCYAKLKTNSMAEYLLTQAIIFDPNYDIAYLDRAKVRFDMELYKDATDDLYEFLIKYPEHVEALGIRSASNFNLKNYSAAIVDYDKLIALQPDNWEWYFEKGNCLVKLKRDAEADEMYTIALVSTTNKSWVLVMRGIVRYNLKRKEEACQDWHQARILGEEEAVLLYTRYCTEE